MPIQLLPPRISEQIAAGEVISRPLDVIRELVDNALDAGATRLEISVQGGGFDRIEVRDNGCGISAAEVGLAPLRHATSKLSPDDTGLEHITTLGFRGEALWATAQVAQLRLTTRPAAQLGASEVFADAQGVQTTRVSAPAGTTVSVVGLFSKLPARRHTQLAPAAEIRDITVLIGRYILHYPQHYWRMSVDGEIRLTHAPSDARGAVATVYGSLSANRVIAVQGEGISGVISRPELTRARRDRMHFAVNGRPVQVPAELEKAVISGYAELLGSGAAPLCVLNLSVPPTAQNPNVHPAKQTIALADIEGLSERLTDAVAQALSGQPLAQAVPNLRPAEPSQTPHPQHFPDLQVIGVYQQLYILAQAEGDLWLIDAHAAHERVLYEQLSGQLGQRYVLPEPELLHLTPEQQANLHAKAEALSEMGLELEDFGAGLMRLRSLPASLAALPVPKLHHEIVESALQGEDPRRAVLGRLACAPALKAGMIGQDEARLIVQQLSACAQPWACPHGRPTTLRLSERDLAHAFGRRSSRDIARGRDL